jgi:hypothetical protein
MTIAEEIFEMVHALPEAQAREVLDFIAYLQSRKQAAQPEHRKAAIAQLARYRGRYRAGKFSRDEIYDRARLR